MAAALANTMGVPAAARVPMPAQAARKSARPVRSTAIRAMADGESPVFRAWDNATNSNMRTDIKKIMILGAGPIVIGQACEFDYSGTQACKALRCVAPSPPHVCVAVAVYACLADARVRACATPPRARFYELLTKPLVIVSQG